MIMALVHLVPNLIETTVFKHQYFFKQIDIVMFENWQWINPRGLSATLYDYKTKNSSTSPNPTHQTYRTALMGTSPNEDLSLKRKPFGEELGDFGI